MQGFVHRSARERNKWALSFAEKPWNWTWPMFMLLRGVLLFIPVTLTIFAAPEGTEARRYSSASLPEVHSITGASSRKGATTVDPPSGRLRIPNAGGVFAIGDVRLNSVKRVAAAVGEGAQVVAALHAFLATVDRERGKVGTLQAP